MMRVHWKLVGDSAACAYEVLPHPKQDRVLAWVSVADPRCLHRCMVGVERALDYGTVSPEVREALERGAKP